MTSEKDLPPDTSREYIEACYKQLCDKAAAIRKLIRENREVYPFEIITIFRHIIDNNLINELHEYAATSITDDSGPPSRAVYALLVHLMVGKKMDYDTNMLLKTGLAALLHYADIHELPDRLLQEDCVLTPGDISEIRKHTAPSLGILMGFNESPLRVSQGEAGEPKEGIETQTALTSEEIAAIRKDKGLAQE